MLHHVSQTVQCWQSNTGREYKITASRIQLTVASVTHFKIFKEFLSNKCHKFGLFSYLNKRPSLL